MRSSRSRSRSALALLGLLVLMVLPRTWFHDCGHAAATHLMAGHAAVASDGHCPICDQVQPHYVQPGPAPVAPTTASQHPLVVVLPAEVPAVCIEAGSTRGPPTI